MKFCELPRPVRANVLLVFAAFSTALACMKVAFALKPNPSNGDGSQLRACCTASSSPSTYADCELVGALNRKLAVPPGYAGKPAELTICTGKLMYSLDQKALIL